MNPQPRKSKAEVTRLSVLQAATELFLQGGTGQLSVRAIAQRADVSTMAIYSHFQGKQGILDALYVEGFEYVARAMNVAGEENTQLTRRDLSQAAKNYLDIGVSYEAHYRLIFGETDSGYTPSREAQQVRDATFAKLVRTARRLLTDSHSNQEAFQFAVEIWALLHGFVSLKHHSIASLQLSSSDAPVRWDWRTSALESIERLASTYRLNQ